MSFGDIHEISAILKCHKISAILVNSKKKTSRYLEKFPLLIRYNTDLRV